MAAHFLGRLVSDTEVSQEPASGKRERVNIGLPSPVGGPLRYLTCSHLSGEKKSKCVWKI